MKLRFHWRMTVYFVLLCLLFIGIFRYLYFSMKVPWFWSSLLGFLPVSFFAYLMFRNLAYPIQRMTEVVKGRTGDHQIRGTYPYDELGGPSRIIDETASQLKGDEIMKSAEARLLAIGMFHTTAIRKSALTSESWGCGSSGSQKKIKKRSLYLQSWHRFAGHPLTARFGV